MIDTQIDYVEEFLNRLRSLYYEKKYPQWFLAQKLDVSQGTINQWIHKTREPDRRIAFYCFELLKEFDKYEYEETVLAFLEKLRNFMETYHFSQQEVADAFGVSRGSIRNWLDDKNIPSKSSRDIISDKIDMLIEQKAELKVNVIEQEAQEMLKIDIDSFVNKLERFYLTHNYTYKELSEMLGVNSESIRIWISRKQKPLRRNAYKLSLKLDELEKAK